MDDELKGFLGARDSGERWLLSGERRGRILGAAQVLMLQGETDARTAIARAWCMLEADDVMRLLAGVPRMEAYSALGAKSRMKLDGRTFIIERSRGKLSVRIAPSPGPCAGFGEPTG